MSSRPTTTTTTKDDNGKDQEPTFRSAEEERNSFDKITSKGRPDGLFQRCMKGIRAAHFQSNRFRAVLVVAGLFSDKNIYTDVISLFYVVTKALEDKLKSVDDDICRILLNELGYQFTKAYEQDLEFLYGSSSWKDNVQKTLRGNPKTQEYLKRIENMTTGSELAGGVFVLWGALIIGGGAAAKPKVQSRYGKDAVHLFESVTGPGREDRKRTFVQVWDSLEDVAKKTGANVETIVESTTACMQGNNDILSSLKRNPWWYAYLQAGAVVGTSVLIYIIKQRYYSI